MNLTITATFNHTYTMDTANPTPSENGSNGKKKRNPHAFRFYERDEALLTSFHDHRFLDVSTLHLLHGTETEIRNTKSNTNLARRLRGLARNKFVIQAQAARPVKGQPGGFVYSLAPKGAEYLAALYRGDPSYEISRKTLEKQVLYPYIEHELGVSRILALVRRAIRDAGDKFSLGVNFGLTPYFAMSELEPIRKTYRVNPDACFTLTFPETENRPATTVHHFVEYDRGTVDPERVAPRYAHYFAWWKKDDELARRERREHPYRHMRILTVSPSAERTEELRDYTKRIGRDQTHARAWQGLWFAHVGNFDRFKPLTILAPIFRFPDGKETVSLLDPFIPSASLRHEGMS